MAAARDKAAWLALGLLPVLAYVVLKYAGYLKLARLGAIALVAASAATFFFLRPRWALYFLVIYTYSGVGFFLPGNVAAPVLAVAVAAVVLAWVRGDEPVLPQASYWIAVGLFTLVALTSSLFARDIAASLNEIVSFLKVVLVVALVVELVRTPEQLRAFSYAVFFGALASVALGAMAIAAGMEGTGDDYVLGVRVLRFAGVHGNPNKAAAYMCMAMPLGFFGLRHAGRWYLRLLFGAGLVVLTVGILATLSRSALGALVVVLLGAAIYELRSRRAFVAALAAVAVIVLVTPRYYWARVLTVPGALSNTGQDWSMYVRTLALNTAWEMFLRNPILGIGLGNFFEASAYRVFVRIVVHNTYVEILVSTGILGLAAFLAAMSTGLRHAVIGARRRWTSQPAWMRSLSYYTLLSGVSIGISALFGTMPFRYPLWIPVAAGLVIGRLARAEARA